jgi:hypothetical protein
MCVSSLTVALSRKSKSTIYVHASQCLYVQYTLLLVLVRWSSKAPLTSLRGEACTADNVYISSLSSSTYQLHAVDMARLLTHQKQIALHSSRCEMLANVIATFQTLRLQRLPHLCHQAAPPELALHVPLSI